MIALLAMTGAILIAQSQPPSPSLGRPAGNQKQASGAQQDKPGTNQAPAISSLPQSNPSQPVPPQVVVQQNAGNENHGTSGYNVLAAILSVLTLAVLGTQVAVMLKQANIADRQNEIVETQNKIMAGQSTIMSGQLSAAQVSANAAEISADAYRQAERAYARMSHYPPGLEIDSVATRLNEGLPRRAVHIKVRVQNHGHMPAHVTSVALRYAVGTVAPSYPPTYDSADVERVAAFLVKDDSFDYSRVFDLTAAEVTNVLSIGNLMSPEPARIWVFGYVDYVNTLDGAKYRASYGRVHNPLIDAKDFGGLYIVNGVFDEGKYQARNNLPFITESGYNDDTEVNEQGQPKQGKG